MRFYRVWYFDQSHAGRGYEWFASRVEARRALTVWKFDQREAGKLAGEFIKDAWGTVEAIEITPTKKGILAALNSHARDDVTEG